SSAVSSGKPEKPTPTGIFSIIEKDRFHRSNLYDDAPMYYMHRLTWSRVAMHEGQLPGFAASHGCIRLPTEVVSKRWQVSKLARRVVVARAEVARHDFEHPNLFEPRPKPAADGNTAELLRHGLRPTLAAAGSPDGQPIRLAQVNTNGPDGGKISDAIAG